MRSFLRKLASLRNHFHIVVTLLLVAVIHVVGWSMPGLFSHSLYAQTTLKVTEEKPIFELGESAQTERPLFELQSPAQKMPKNQPLHQCLCLIGRTSSSSSNCRPRRSR